MAASFSWSQRNGAGGTVTDLGSSGNLWNFKMSDTAVAADYSSNPLTAGGAGSMEVWMRAHLFGSFNRIDGARLWMSTNFSPSAGLQIFWTGTQVTYLQPASGTSSIATSSIPTADPGTANVSMNGSLSGSLVASGYTDHMVFQLRTTLAAAPGDTSLATLTFSYLEN